jgi:hypothetical protein
MVASGLCPPFPHQGGEGLDWLPHEKAKPADLLEITACVTGGLYCPCQRKRRSDGYSCESLCAEGSAAAVVVIRGGERQAPNRDGRSAVRDTPGGSPPIRNRWVAIQFRNSSSTAGAVRESVDVDMLISCDSSPPLVRLLVMRRSLRKLYPFLKMPVTGWGCGDGCLYPSLLLRK